MNKIIRVENISFFYRENKFYMENITFSVEKGEFLGIIGPNGSGKTTLLRLLTGFLHPFEGKIFIKQKNLVEIKHRERAKILSVVPQGISTFFNFRVKEIVSLGRLPYQDEDEKIIERAMQRADVLQLRDRRFFSLSGGEKQRVLIAKSLAQEPEVLLLDEFTSHLDIYHEKSIIDILKEERKRRSLTIIATFHDINLASILSDRLVIFKNGKILAYGSPNEVINIANLKAAYLIEPLIHLHPKYKVPQIFYP